jgi:precorrin-6Y C5,15-methyltransferase (decarboxylating)
MSSPWLAILGINEDGALSPEAAGLLSRAALVMGGARHLALAAPHITGEAQAWPTPMIDALPGLLARRGTAVAVLASGDPLWFGIGSTLLRHVPVAETRIIPAPSTFALAAARLGWALQDVECLSCCGRPLAALLPHLHDGARLLVLSADAGTPVAVHALLAAQGFGGSTLHVLEALGGPRERVRRNPPLSGLDALNMLAVEVSGRGWPLTPLDDEAFEHDGQITKSEIRAMTLAALAPRPGALLWDVGAGSGSICIEWMRRHRACRAIAIEARPERAARVRRNANALGVPGLVVAEGTAPVALHGLPAPDAVFLGGGAHRDGVIDAAWTALRPGGRLVANAIAVATEAALFAAQARLGGTLSRIGVERLDQVGGMAAFRPAMTVTQWKVTRP